MTIAEPMTMLTDYALAGVTGWLGWRLYHARAMQNARLWWAIALIALALAAVLGGTHHGFAPVLGSGALNLLWKATLTAIGVAFFGMVTGSARALTVGTLRTALLALATAQLVVYLALVMGHDDYILAVADTAAAMVVLVALHGWSYAVRRDRASAFMLLAIAVSAVAVGVQAGRYAPHPHFNHNDLYHVIQIVAMTLLYKGASLLHDRATS
ncbi:MAG: hypothetical protein ABL878_17780 [Burkholderiales bacterium]